MKITAIKLRRLVNSGNKMVGVVSLTFDNMIVLHDIKILKSEDGLFIAMPSRQTKARTFKDIVHPINSEVRQAIENLVFATYEISKKNMSEIIEMTLVETDCSSLLEQTITHFEVVSSSSGEKYVNQNASDEIDKWLNS